MSDYLKSWLWPPPPPPPTTSWFGTFSWGDAGDVLVGIVSFLYNKFPFTLFFVFCALGLVAEALDPVGRKAREQGKRILESFGINPRTCRLSSHDLAIASELIHPKVLEETWTSVGGHDEIVAKLMEAVILPLKVAQSGMDLPPLARPPNGILLYGAPGCGKTLMAKALAKNGQYKFLNINAASFTNKFYGETEKHIKALFHVAEVFSPCIIFLDEIDAILSKRGGENEWEMSRTIKTLFMQLWDGLLKDPKKTVIILGATNRPNDLDEAVLRRMPLKIEVPLPTRLQREEIIKVILEQNGQKKGQYALEENVDIGRVAELTEGFSGSDLKEVVRSACIRSLKEEFNTVCIKGKGERKENEMSGSESGSPVENSVPSGFENLCRPSADLGVKGIISPEPRFGMINKIFETIRKAMSRRTKDQKTVIQPVAKKKKLQIKMSNLISAVEENKAYKSNQGGGKEGFSYYI